MRELSQLKSGDHMQVVRSSNRGRRLKVYSLTLARFSYYEAGAPYGRNRKGLKRWLRETKAFAFFCAGDEHRWREGYYGYQCTRCTAFYAYGSAPWEYVWTDDDYDDHEREMEELFGSVVAGDDDDDDDEFYPADECGRGNDYEGCMLAGTEFCDWECPYSR